MYDAALRIDGVSCRYETENVLENIDFSAGPGEFVGVIGPNASGKSTLLRSISRTLKPHLGVVLLNEKDLYSLKSLEVARQLAVVPQESIVSFAFTALEVVLMGRTPHIKRLRMEAAQDLLITRKVMELTRVWDLRDRPFNTLSGGEKQRVIIARSLAQEPRVLLLDEPTGHLDINHQIEILNLITHLVKDGRMLVMAVFHDLNIAAQYSERLILIRKGKIFAAGGVDDVLTRENIESVYGIRVTVGKDHISGRLLIHPQKIRQTQVTKGNVHIIAGSGSAVSLMSELLDDGWNVSLGVINLGDSEGKYSSTLSSPNCKTLQSKSETENPFSLAKEAKRAKPNGGMQEETLFQILPESLCHGGFINNMSMIYYFCLWIKIIFILVGDCHYRRISEFFILVRQTFYASLI